MQGRENSERVRCHTSTVGLWVQAIGVRGELPDGLAVEHDEEFALPWSAGTGWRWAVLSEDWQRDLGRVAVDVAAKATAAVLTFLIADSDLAILHGAAPGEPPVVASTGEYEEPGPETQARAFAEWTERHAPAAVAAKRFDEWSQTRYVFAEEGLAYLLAQMGLVEQTTEPPETLDD
jgi:hypothetical protein